MPATRNNTSHQPDYCHQIYAADDLSPCLRNHTHFYPLFAARKPFSGRQLNLRHLQYRWRYAAASRDPGGSTRFWCHACMCHGCGGEIKLSTPPNDSASVNNDSPPGNDAASAHRHPVQNSTLRQAFLLARGNFMPLIFRQRRVNSFFTNGWVCRYFTIACALRAPAPYAAPAFATHVAADSCQRAARHANIVCPPGQFSDNVRSLAITTPATTSE